MKHLRKFISLNDPNDRDGLKHLPGPPRCPARILYIYGDSAVSVKSLANRGWLAHQSAKLASPLGIVTRGQVQARLLEAAIVRQRQRFERYDRPQILMLRFEEIWTSAATIADHFEISDPAFLSTFPTRRGRRSEVAD